MADLSLVSPQIALEQLGLLSTTPHEVAFWTGAGISANAPTSLPLGFGLTKAVIDHFCIAGSFETLLAYYAQAQLCDADGNPKSMPRLEFIFDCLANAIGLQVLQSLSAFSTAPSNLLHHFFAQHIHSGGRHITVNFDQCIEDSPAFRLEDYVLHVHGRYQPDDEAISTLGARLATVASGLTAPMQAEIIDILTSVRFLVFVGYSGSDYFDVNPFFRSLSELGVSLPNLRAIWISHRGSPEDVLIQEGGTALPGRTILTSLALAGARPIQVQSPTAALLLTLREAWFGPMDERSIPATDGSRTFAITTPVTPCERLSGAIRIYEAMGLGAEITRREDAIRNCCIESDASYQHQNRGLWSLEIGYRDQGSYRKARSVLSEIKPTSAVEQLRKQERLASVCWLAGDHLGAWWMLRRALTMADNAGPSLPGIADIRNAIMVAFLHWFRDVGSTPVLGRFANLAEGSNVRRIYGDLCAAEAWNAIPARSQSALVRLHQEIPVLSRDSTLSPPQSHSRESLVGPFSESDSFIGVANFTRRQIIQDIERGSEIPQEQLGWLKRLSETIGDNPGVLKSSLLLRRYGNDATGLPWQAWRKTEWTWMRKLTWLMQWLSANR